MQYLSDNFQFLVPALWVLGYALKSTPRVPDWSIVWILIGVSAVMAVFSFDFTAEAVINSIVAAGAAVLGHQLVKQTVKGFN